MDFNLLGCYSGICSGVVVEVGLPGTVSTQL